jgi:hypothetical protein
MARFPGIFPGLVLGAVAILSTTGCGGRADLGSVTGTITLDGQPLADAIVTFEPGVGGAPSRAITDAKGHYQLRYTRELLGAKVGEHVVSVSTFRSANPDAEPPRPAVPEQVPPRFNGDTELRAEVGPGGNRIDFALRSTGPVPQPNLADY